MSEKINRIQKIDTGGSLHVIDLESILYMNLYNLTFSDDPVTEWLIMHHNGSEERIRMDEGGKDEFLNLFTKWKNYCNDGADKVYLLND